MELRKKPPASCQRLAFQTLVRGICSIASPSCSGMVSKAVGTFLANLTRAPALEITKELIHSDNFLLDRMGQRGG